MTDEKVRDEDYRLLTVFAEAAMKCLDALTVEYLQALRDLVKVVRATEKPINQCIGISFAHGCPYMGPNWEKEIEAAEKIITRADGLKAQKCNEFPKEEGNWETKGNPKNVFTTTGPLHTPIIP